MCSSELIIALRLWAFSLSSRREAGPLRPLGHSRSPHPRFLKLIKVPQHKCLAPCSLIANFSLFIAAYLEPHVSFPKWPSRSPISQNTGTTPSEKHWHAEKKSKGNLNTSLFHLALKPHCAQQCLLQEDVGQLANTILNALKQQS